MTYLDRRSVGLSVVCAALAGCTANPWFGLDRGDDGSGSATGGMTEGPGPTTGATPTTSEPSGTGSAGGTTEAGATSTTGISSLATTEEPEETTKTAAPETTENPGEDTGDESSTGMNAGCGDGVVAGDEECDLGADNGENSECTPKCKLAKCGDGFAYTDAGEECDAGELNDDTGLLCTTECTLPKCGDGKQQVDEACDAGPLNGKPMLNGCSSDCKAFLKQLEIRVIGATTTGKLQKNGKTGVAGADELCATTFMGPWKALISDDETRIASENPWLGDGQVDWVLHPYTIYVNIDQDPNIEGKLVDITGPVALLGKPEENSPALFNAIGLIPAPVWTGLNADWTSSGLHCNKWNSAELGPKGTVGQSSDAVDKYLDNGDPAGCGELRRLYCVQQPG